MNKLVKLLLLICFIVGLGFVATPLFNEQIAVKSKGSVNNIDLSSTNHFVSQDFISLYKAGKIPKSFLDLKSIDISYRDEQLKSLIPTQSLPFKTSKKGRYKLEVEAFSAPDEKFKVVVLQLNLFDTKNGNKIFELSRNYEVKNQ